MEAQKVKLSAIAIRYGLIGALISIIFSMVIFFLGMQEAKWQQYVPYIILTGVLVFAAKFYRDEVLDGKMSFGQGFKLSILTTVVIAIISIVWVYIYMSFIDPDLVEMIMEKQITKMEESGRSGNEIEQALNFIEKFNTPPVMALIAGLGYIFFGTIISIIVSAVMQKK